MKLLKIAVSDSHRGAIEAFVGVLASSALLGGVLYLILFAGQVL